MHDHGHGTEAAGMVIAVHVAAMYLPSPLTGRLVDRVGRTTMAAASGVTLLAAGLLAASAPDDSVVLLALALALLGLGWNFGLVSGSAIITDAVPLETRARTQGLVDVSIAIAGAGAGWRRASWSTPPATRRSRWPAACSPSRSCRRSRRAPGRADLSPPPDNRTSIVRIRS